MKEKVIPIFEKNTAQINRNIANMLAGCSILIIIMVSLSAEGFFEFGFEIAECIKFIYGG